MPDSTTVANETMTGSEVIYTVPAGTAVAYFRARGGDIQMRSVTGSTPYITIDNGQNLVLNARTVSGKTYYFTGASGVVLEVMLWLGAADTR